MYERRRLLPLTIAARALGVTSKWLRAEAESSRVPHLDAGGRLLFDVNAVEEALLQRARGEVAEAVPA